MKNKNTVIALLVVFVLICGYNLYWTYVQFSMDSKRTSLQEQRDAIMDKDLSLRNMEDTLKLEEYNQFVNDEGDTEKTNQKKYQKAIDNSFTLGLDLQGGMFVTMEVGIEELLKQLAGSSRNDSIFIKGIKQATTRAQSGEQAAYVDIFVEEIKKIDPNANLGAMFSNRARGIGSSSDDATVREMLRTESSDAIDRTFEILRARIDQFGVVSPNLQKQETTGRILLELPGVKEP
ncbi:hypothetical protein N9933_02780, partial [bacterium]|nr:hypothetical protein [bacterium]